MLPRHIALACLWRTFFINCANTARGMQQIGLAFVLAPALHCLYPEGEARARAFARHGGHSNTHVFMLPLYAGIIISLEEQIANRTLPETALGQIRETLGTTLSALGDSFFSGTLLPLWALSSIFLLLGGHVCLTVSLTLTALILLNIFRPLSFFAALRYGIPVLLWVRRLDLVNWGTRLKLVNAVLVALVVWQLHLALHLSWLTFTGGIAAVLAAAWLIGRRGLPRLLLWAAGVSILLLAATGSSPYE